MCIVTFINFVCRRKIEEELEGYALPRATPNKFNDWHQRSNDKVREIDISMIIPTPTTSENNDPSNCIGRGVFGTCYKRLFQGLPVCVKICNYQSERGKQLVQNEAAVLSSLCHPFICWCWGVQTKRIHHTFMVTTLYTIDGINLSLHNLLGSPSSRSIAGRQ